MPLKTEVSPLPIRNNSSESERNEDNNCDNTNDNKLINNNENLEAFVCSPLNIINTKDESLNFKNPVFSCLNIKRLVANLKKFNSPILKKTPEKQLRKIEENLGIVMKTEENANASRAEKTTKKHKRYSFIENLQKNAEISPYQRYELFLRSMNFSNNLSVNISKSFFCFKAHIGKGNNKTLVKTLIKNRWWWSIVDSIEENTNFVWTQMKNKSFIEILKKQTSSEEKENTQESSLNKASILTFGLVENLKSLINADDLSFLKKSWKSLNNIKKAESFAHLNIPRSLELKIHNHFENNYHLGNKKALFYNLRDYYEMNSEEVFLDIPMTFHIRKGLEDPEYKTFLYYFHEMKEKTGQKLWIIKPGERSNRGKGIDICEDLNQINQIISSKAVHKNGKIKTYILQSYIENPLLYNKRKFDIRCYVLLTNFNQNLKGYWYREGYIRTSSKDFSLKNLNNKLIHLTNDAIQKKSDDYGKFEPSNKVSFEEFQKYMRTNYPEKKFDFAKDIHNYMKEKATKAIKAVYGKINKDIDTLNQNSMVFEIFGLDFMIDENLKVWLIEINTNPCLELSSPLLGKIIPNMLENAFRLSIDCLFPAPFLVNPSKYQRITNYFENNKFELIFDEFVDSMVLKELYSKSPGCHDRYLVNLDDEESDEQTDQ